MEGGREGDGIRNTRKLSVLRTPYVGGLLPCELTQNFRWICPRSHRVAAPPLLFCASLPWPPAHARLRTDGTSSLDEACISRDAARLTIACTYMRCRHHVHPQSKTTLFFFLFFLSFLAFFSNPVGCRQWAHRPTCFTLGGDISSQFIFAYYFFFLAGDQLVHG